MDGSDRSPNEKPRSAEAGLMYRAGDQRGCRPNLRNMPRGCDGTMTAARQLCGLLSALGDLGHGSAAAPGRLLHVAHTEKKPRFGAAKRGRQEER